MIKWKDERIFISHTLEGETIAFDEINEGIWSVYYTRFSSPGSTRASGSSIARRVNIVLAGSRRAALASARGPRPRLGDIR